MIRRCGVLAVAALFAAGCAAPSTRAAGDRNSTVTLPRRLMFGWEVLCEVHLQTGLRYACPTGTIVRQIDASQFNGAAPVNAVLKKLGPMQRRDDIVTFAHKDVLTAGMAPPQLSKTKDVDKRRKRAYRLSDSCHYPLLFEGLTDKDESVRHHCLRSLVRLERDFRMFAPAGRVSVLSSLDSAIGARLTERLRKLMETAPDRSTNQWLWAAELIGRIGRPVERPVREELRAGTRHGYARTREVAAWALGQVSPREPTVRMVQDRRDAASVALVLAGLRATDAEELVGGIRKAKRHALIGAGPLLGLYTKQTDDRVRAEVLLALGRKGGEKVWDFLLEKMKSENAVIRRAAIRALRRCPDPRAIGPLVEQLTGKGHAGTDRNLAAMSLGLIGGETVVRRLTEYVNRTKQPISTTALALGWTDRRDAVPALIRCSQAPKASLQSYAFNALARLGTKEAVDAIAARYGHRNNITRYMGHAAIRLAGAWNQEAVDRYVEVLSGGSGRIAAHGLEMAEDPRAVDVLIDQIPRSKGARLFWMVQSLGRIGDPKAVPTLVKLLDHESEMIRYEAMRALRWRWYWHRDDVRGALRKHPVFKELVEPRPSLEDQEPNTWVLRHWPIDFDDYRACNTSYEAGLMFDGSTGKIVKWGAHGQRCDTPQLGETWLYDPAKNEWEQSESPVEPYGMCGTWGTIYDKANRCIVSVQATGCNHGWQWSWGRATRVSAPWLYFGEHDRWIPVRADTPNPGPRGFCPLAYHDRARVTMLYRGQWGWGDHYAMWLYDAYTNEWHKRPAVEPRPGGNTNFGWAYLPERNKTLRIGGSYGDPTNQTWLYDLATNTWTDAKAKGDPPAFRQPVEYDPVSKSVLAWRLHSGHAPAVWQYRIAKNAWKKLPPAKGMTPHHDSVDICYDPRHNVFVLDGGHLNWHSDHIGVREVWTYKLTPGGPPKKERLAAPQDVEARVVRTVRTEAALRPEGDRPSVELSWAAVDGADHYAIYRGAGATPWEVEFEKVETVPGDTTKWTDGRGPRPDEVIRYYVAAVKDLEEGRPSTIVRAQPRFPLETTASIREDRTVDVEWSKSGSADVVGYNVYAATMDVGDRAHPSSMKTFGEWTKLNEKLLEGTSFHDDRKLGGPSGFLGHELRGYVIKAVNAAGIESGPSSLARTLTSSVPSVEATQRPDGSTLVTWKPVPEKHIRGYAVYRMDEYRHSLPIRITPYPVQGTSFVDWCEARDAERRRYYVVAIDALGQKGEPSTGAWAFGRP